ncbi:MAG: copper ion binding protein, partial [Methanobacteriota archaeon]
MTDPSRTMNDIRELSQIDKKQDCIIMTDAKIKIEGMMCGHCQASVTKAISSVVGVSAVKVNLENKSATVEFDEGATNLNAIKQAVTDAGYEVGEQRITQPKSEAQQNAQACPVVIGDDEGTVEKPAAKHGSGATTTIALKISGMTCAACAANIEKVLKKLKGVESVAVIFSLAKAQVEYDPSLVSVAEMVSAIEGIGYTASRKVDKKESEDRERKAREDEIKKQRINLIIAVALGIPISFGDMANAFPNLLWFVPSFLTDDRLLFVLTTIVMLFPGRQFFVGTYKGLKHGVTDMNLLIATGTGAAYAVSVAATFLDLGPGYMHTYYDTAALLITFIVLGRYLEATTKGKTSEAIRKLMGLQAKTARIIVNGVEKEVPVEEVA